MAESETIKHPTEILSEDIIKFTQDIECLHTTLPLLMTIMLVVNKNAHDKFRAFITEHALDKIDKDDQTTYSLKVDDIAKHVKLKRRYDTTQIATIFIPRHFITSLVSQYDSFLGRIIRFIFAVSPQKLNASEKTIAYTDLLQFPNIDAAREYIIEKEVETIIRKNPVEQFSWLQEKLGTPFNKDLKSWPVFIELNERRNLFVHCDGRVSSQYLRICSKYECSIDAYLKVGDQLEASPEYFEEAYKCMYEIGIKLAHIIWRRLSPEHLIDSDIKINELTYGLIEKGEYDLAIRLLDYFTQTHIKHSSDSKKRMMIINLAQAYKWTKDNEACKKILKQADWSACGDNYKLAVLVLEEQYNIAYTVMRRLKNDDSFLKTYYKDWPLFKEFKKQECFASIYEECYGEPFKVQQKTEEEKKEIVIENKQIDDKSKIQ